MFEKAIRKAVLSILLAIQVGAGCRITCGGTAATTESKSGYR